MALGVDSIALKFRIFGLPISRAIVSRCYLLINSKYYYLHHLATVAETLTRSYKYETRLLKPQSVKPHLSNACGIIENQGLSSQDDLSCWRVRKSGVLEDIKFKGFE